jgi:RNA polymerase sigma factor (sigma-70 family)
MADDGTHPILRSIRKLAAAGDDRRAADAPLLARYATQRDEAAFEVLVHRHGAMVWHVCRTVLRESHAAEDAFQATFLVLVRKAGSIGRPELLANWLYGVAYRVAQQARKVRGKQAAHERQGAEMLAVTSTVEATSDWQPLLQEELQRLPAKYRSPMVLCYLEGHTNEEAARQLRWPVGTLKVRLLRGREMLRTRLARRGLVLTTAGLAAALPLNSAQAVPAPLVDTTIRGAFAFASGRAAEVGPGAATLAEGALAPAVSWTKGKVAVAVLVAGLLASGAGLFAYHAHKAPPVGQQTGTPDLKPEEAPRPDREPGAAEEDAARKAAAALEGRWKLVAVELAGQKPGSFQPLDLVLKPDGKALFCPAGMEIEIAWTVDPKPSPRRITLVNGEQKHFGIYKLDGGRLTICMTKSGTAEKDRPQEFTTKGTDYQLWVLGPVKPAKETKPSDPAPPKGEPKPPPRVVQVRTPNGWYLDMHADGSGQLGYGSLITDVWKFKAETFDVAAVSGDLATLVGNDKGYIGTHFRFGVERGDGKSPISGYTREVQVIPALLQQAKEAARVTDSPRGAMLWEKYPPRLPSDEATRSDAGALLEGSPWTVASVTQDGKSLAPAKSHLERVLLEGDAVTFGKGATLDVAVKRKGGDLKGMCNLGEPLRKEAPPRGDAVPYAGGPELPPGAAHHRHLRAEGRPADAPLPREGVRRRGDGRGGSRPEPRPVSSRLRGSSGHRSLPRPKSAPEENRFPKPFNSPFASRAIHQPRPSPP